MNEAEVLIRHEETKVPIQLKESFIEEVKKTLKILGAKFETTVEST
jgi:hypothetical protein